MKAYLSTIKSVRMGNGISVNIYELRIFRNDNAKMTGKGRTKPDLYFTRTSGHRHPQWMVKLADCINSGNPLQLNEYHLSKEEKEELENLLKDTKSYQYQE